MIVSRGCPYSCRYCINNHINKKYGKFILRRRSVDNVLEEIDSLSQSYEIKKIVFHDDMFTHDSDWIINFCTEYAKRFSIPWTCMARVDRLNENMLVAMKKANCVEIRMGIESGSERIRKEILNRHMSNADIEKVFHAVKQAGIHAYSLNMIGIPTETKEDLLETIKLNARIRPYIMRVSILFPYPKTELYDYCIQNQLIDTDAYDHAINFFDRSTIRLEHLTPVDIVKYKTMFKWYVDFYSGIEVSDFYGRLIDFFEKLPEEAWLQGEAQKMFREIDRNLNEIFRPLFKEHYVSRGLSENDIVDLNYSANTDWNLP